MKVLITGSAGYIGKYLEKYLNDKKIFTISFDWSKGQNILNTRHLRDKLKYADYIIHLAAIADVYKVAQDPITALRIGIEGTTKLIQVANEFPIKKLIYISTWEVYGKPKYLPIDEDHYCNPDHPYSIAKFGGELIVKSYLNKTPWLILRLGTVYGGNMRSSSVILKFINRSLNNEPIIIHGTGNQNRQFTHISDICNGIFLALKSDEKNDTFNIIDNYNLKVKELAYLVKKLTDSHSQIKFENSREGDAIASSISNKKAKTKLGWFPKKKFKMALKEIIDKKF